MFDFGNGLSLRFEKSQLNLRSRSIAFGGDEPIRNEHIGVKLPKKLKVT